MASRKSLITHHDERDRTIEGYLKKKTSMFAWKRHFVVVDERGTLSYFANELALHPSLNLHRNERRKARGSRPHRNLEQHQRKANRLNCFPPLLHRISCGFFDLR